MSALAVEAVRTLEEIGTAERCVVCGAAAETSIPLEPAAGVALGRDADRIATRTLRACRACAQAQADARVTGRKVLYVSFAAAPVLAFAAGTLAPGANGVVAAGSAVALQLFVRVGVAGAIRRARARRVRALVLEADGDRVLLQLAARGAEPGAAGYRSAAAATEASDTPVQPRPPRVSAAFWSAGSFLVSAVVVAAAVSGGFDRTSRVYVDTPRDDVIVTFDGKDRIELHAGGMSWTSMRTGRHAYRVEYVATGQVWSGTFDVSAWNEVLLSTDPSQCYRVWREGSGPVEVHENGPVRWATTTDARNASRAPCRH